MSATRPCGCGGTGSDRCSPARSGQRVSRMRGFRHWRWHPDEMYVKLSGEMVYLWRAFEQEGEVLESDINKTRDKDAALTFMKKARRRPISGSASPGARLMAPISAFRQPELRARRALELKGRQRRVQPVVTVASAAAALCWTGGH